MTVSEQKKKPNPDKKTGAGNTQQKFKTLQEER